MIQKNNAAIEPRSFIALIELLETYKQVESVVSGMPSAKDSEGVLLVFKKY